MDATPKKTRQTAANNEFLAESKRLFNSMVYKRCLDLINSDGGEQAAREWLKSYVGCDLDS